MYLATNGSWTAEDKELTLLVRVVRVYRLQYGAGSR
jgi:hypothetical protein